MERINIEAMPSGILRGAAHEMQKVLMDATNLVHEIGYMIKYKAAPILISHILIYTNADVHTCRYTHIPIYTHLYTCIYLCTHTYM